MREGGREGGNRRRRKGEVGRKRDGEEVVENE